MKNKTKFTAIKRIAILIIAVIIASGIFVLAMDSDNNPEDYGYIGYYENGHEGVTNTPPTYDGQDSYDYVPNSPTFHEFLNLYDLDYSHNLVIPPLTFDEAGSEHNDGYVYENTPHHYGDETYLDYHSGQANASYSSQSGGVSFEDFVAYRQYNDCHHAPYSCYCHIDYWPSPPTGFTPFGGYIGITPLSEIVLEQVTSISELVTRISQVPIGTGNMYVIPIAFPGNAVITTDLTTLSISSNRHIILDSAGLTNQVWYRNASSGRHFHVSSNATLELRNVTFTRSADWRAVNPGVVSGGGNVHGTFARLILSHQSATISYNHSATGWTMSGAVNVQSGGAVYMSAGNIINNTTNGNGGAIHLDGIGLFAGLTMTGGIISGNTAAGHGGAVGKCCASTINLYNGHIFNNTSGTFGGGIGMGANGNNRMYMHGGTIGHETASLGNTAGTSGGGVHTATWNVHFIMHGGRIINNVANHAGGGVYVAAWGPFIMHGGFIGDANTNFGNTASVGGGVAISGEFTMHGGNILGNAATTTNQPTGGLGGGLSFTSSTANFIMQGLGAKNISGNTARLGGGVFFEQGTWNFGTSQGLNIMGNNATDGGGLWVGGASNLTLTGAMSIYNNTATGSGGGVYIEHGSQLLLNNPNATIGHISPANGNTAARGGGISVSGMLFFEEGNIIGNTAVGLAAANAGLGGGVYLSYEDAMVVFNDAGNKNINANTARLGGGLHWGQGLTHINPGAIGVSFTNNTATADGGGMWVSSEDPIYFGNLVEIYGNSAVNGAGIMIDVNTTFNMVGAYHIFDNTASGAGGGIMIAEGSEVVMFNTDITIGHTSSALGNTAARGGGVSINGTLRWIDGEIIGNAAIGTATTAGLGGGIHFGHVNATLSMQGPSTKNITGNRARLGGGVHWSQGSWVIQPWSGPLNITNNYADINLSSNGGGIHISGSRIWPTSNNNVVIAVDDNFATSQGGGIHISGGASLSINNNWSISENTSNSRGGGITMTGIPTTLTMNGGAILDNTANGTGSNPGGGGVDVFGGGTFTMHDGLIHGNRMFAAQDVASYGGGVNVEGIMAGWDSAIDEPLWGGGSYFYMYGGEISNNHAPQGGGGGVHVLGAAEFTLDGGEIRDNTAGHGGGVWLQGQGIFTMYSGYVNDNTAGVGPGSHTMDGFDPGVIANRNGGGGGVMVCCRARMYMHGGTIDGNTGRVGGGIYLAHGGRDFPSGEYRPGSHAFATIYGGLISNNTATLDWEYYPNLEFDGDGGGIFITRTGILTFAGNTPIFVNNNIAENSGGGVRWVTGHWETEDNTSIVQFIGNEATQDGGGIYVGGGIFREDNGNLEFVPGNLTTHGTWTISHNEATRGGGVFVGGGYFLDGNNEPVHYASTLELTYGALVANNTAFVDGGGIFLYDGVNFNMTHGTNIHSNEAQNNGGGVFVSYEATFTMVGGLIGGGRSFITNPDVNSNTTISTFANSAQRGGGVYLTSGATFIMEQGTAIISGAPTPTIGAIRGNRAWSGGGGVAVVDDDDSDVLFILRDGIIAGNLTPGGGVGTQPSRVSGGGVLVAGEGALFEMDGGTIDDNFNPFWSGAGVTVMGGAEFVMTDGYITNNMAMISGGGGVAVRHYATFTMDGGTISGNDSVVGSGVLSYNRGLFIMEDGLITGNYVRGIGTFIHPGGNLGGGGLGVVAEANAIMRGGTITNHHLRTAWDDGGGVWVGEILAAVSGEAHFEGVSTFLMEGGYIIDNSARRGGGVFGYGSVGIAGPPGVGLSIYVDYIPEGGLINEAPSTIIESQWFNHLIETAMERHSYTGITPFTNDRSQFIMTDGTIEDNLAHTNGGGVHAANGFLLFISDDALIIENLAQHDGGGIWIGEIDTPLSNPGTSILEMSGGTVTENIANRRGGGIFITDAVGDITGGEISENTATNVNGLYVAGATGPWNGSGGGIYVTVDGVLSVEEAEITGNHAAQMGGGIFTELHQYAVPILSNTLAYSNLTIDDSTYFDDNTAGQGAFTPPANAFAWTGIPGTVQNIASTSIHNHPINNFDINWRRGTPVPFRFHKTDQGTIGNTSFMDIEDIEPYLLEGAYFTLFRFVGTGTIPERAYVGSPLWEVVVANVRSTGNILTPIVMNLTPESVYHLVEVMAPANFQIPMGQWRITVNAGATGGFTVQSVGGITIPAFNFLDGHFYVSNLPGFDLPLTGGRSTGSYVYSGFMVVSLAMVGIVYIYAKRKRLLAIR